MEQQITTAESLREWALPHDQRSQRFREALRRIFALDVYDNGVVKFSSVLEIPESVYPFELPDGVKTNDELIDWLNSMSSPETLVEHTVKETKNALDHLVNLHRPSKEIAEKLVAILPSEDLDKINEYMQSVQEAIDARKAQLQQEADGEKADMILKAMGKTREELLEAGIDPVAFVNNMLETSAQSLKKETTV